MRGPGRTQDGYSMPCSASLKPGPAQARAAMIASATATRWRQPLEHALQASGFCRLIHRVSPLDRPLQADGSPCPRAALVTNPNLFRGGLWLSS